MKLLAGVLCLICLSLAVAADVYEDLIHEIFTTPEPKGESLADLVKKHKENVNREGVEQTRYCDGGAGECVPIKLCANNQVITDGAGLIDIRFQEDSPCTYLETCCGAAREGNGNIPTPSPDPGHTGGGQTGHSGNIIDEPITPKPIGRIGCGHRNQDGVGFRITGNKDKEAEFGEFPWMVAILKEQEYNGQILNVYQCGGSLIHPQVVLTGAHCVQTFRSTPEKLKIRAGEWDTQTKNELLEHQDRNVYEIAVHENFYKGGLYNDVALLFLSDPVDTTNDHIGPVCLPPPNHNFDYSQCFASGWGKDVFGKEGKYQVILKKVPLPVVPNEQCQTALRTTRLGAKFTLHSSFICAGGVNGKDTCNGDGGSPLVCPIPGSSGQYYQAGLVAWGIGCGEDSIPGVYANIAAFRDWIDHHLGIRNIDNSYYQYF